MGCGTEVSETMSLEAKPLNVGDRAGADPSLLSRALPSHPTGGTTFPAAPWRWLTPQVALSVGAQACRLLAATQGPSVTLPQDPRGQAAG